MLNNWKIAKPFGIDLYVHWSFWILPLAVLLSGSSVSLLTLGTHLGLMFALFFCVILHEFGHALGLAHSTVSTADMYSTYTGQKQTLTSDDISGVQAVYGARQPDQYDTGSGNNTSAYASNITPLVNANAQASIPSLDITTAIDYDWYVVTAPANTSSTLTVTMQSTGLSSLSP